MGERIEPALTPEQWAKRQVVDAENQCGVWTDEAGEFWVSYDSNGASDGPLDRRAVAALALHGQPFGFTRQDVAVLRSAADGVDAAHAPALLSLADRLAALLPPDEAEKP